MGGRRKRTLNAFRRLCVPKPSFASNSMVLIPPALDDRHPVGFRRAGGHSARRILRECGHLPGSRVSREMSFATALSMNSRFIARIMPVAWSAPPPLVAHSCTFRFLQEANRVRRALRGNCRTGGRPATYTKVVGSPGGPCVVCFQPALITDVRQGPTVKPYIPRSLFATRVQLRSLKRTTLRAGGAS